MNGNNNVDLDVAVAKLEVHLTHLKDGIEDIKTLMTVHINDDKANFDKLELRLAALEKKETWISGKISGIIATVTLLFVIIKEFIFK